MIAFCVESSHQKGMGHIFRCLHLLEYLKPKDERGIVLINNDKQSIKLLEERNVVFENVDLADMESEWESDLVDNYGISAWINDRMDTDIRHSNHVKKNHIPLITFDDRGSGARLSDLHFAALVFENPELLQGAEVLTGIEYLVLNPEIKRYRRLRKKADNILISLGGSDTYGVTCSIVRMLKTLGMGASIHLGPSFNHRKQLDAELDDTFEIISSVPSLIREFSRFELLISGGGITPFEANASGLPCIIVASEFHEKEIGRFLHSKGSSHYLGFRDDISVDGLESALCNINIAAMSSVGMTSFDLKGVENIWNTIRENFHG